MFVSHMATTEYLGWAHIRRAGSNSTAHAGASGAASNGAGATTRTTTITRCYEEPLKDRREGREGRKKTSRFKPFTLPSAGVLPSSWGWLWLRGGVTGKPGSKSEHSYHYRNATSPKT